MDSLLSTFNIDVKLLVAQAVNFAIVFAVLYFFALKPLLKIMAERTKKIEKSVKDAAEIEKRLEKTEADYNKEISRARAEANEIIAKAQEKAEVKRKDMVAKAKEEIGAIINEEKAGIQKEKAKTLKEIRVSVAELVVSAMEKVIEKKFSDKENKEMIKKMISKQ